MSDDTQSDVRLMDVTLSARQENWSYGPMVYWFWAHTPEGTVTGEQDESIVIAWVSFLEASRTAVNSKHDNR